MDYVASGGGVLMPQHAVLGMGGVWHGQHIRDGKVIDEWEDRNLIVNEGLDHILNVEFHGTTPITSWYIGVFEGNYTPVATVTAATITAAATESTAYDETTRVAYDEAASSAQSMTNSASKSTFTFNATKTIYGAFLASASAKSATSGVLFAAAKFGTSKAVVDDDQLLLTYTINASSV
jgi:allantoicase